LWNQAWRLADFIDDPKVAPIEGRRAKLPELYHLRAQMADIERQGAAPGTEPPAVTPPGTWIKLESDGTSTRDTTPEQCPAMCRRSGKCYGKAYFEGKPGKAAECIPADCKHISNERGNDER
jgi:hypothetical protein